MDLLSLINSSTITHYTVDSRQVVDGSLFFALKGEKVDGHNFLQEVAEKGGQIAVVSKLYSGPSFGLCLIKVDSPLKTLQELAQDHLKRKSPFVIGVTGSVGKTTTKDWITTLLSQEFKVASTPGNQNTQVTLPLTILNLLKDATHLVLEMGMTHPGNIKKLIEIAPPKIALVTQVTHAHLSNFPSLAEIADEKASIFTHQDTSLSLFLHEIPYKDRLLQKIHSPYKTFSSLNPDADFFFHEEPLGMKHLSSNLAAAVLVAKTLNVPEEKIVKGIKELKMSPGRMEWVEKGGIKILNDSYNANLLSTLGAFEVFSKVNAKKKVAVFGEMKELGLSSKEMHEKVGLFALNKVDLLFCFGQESFSTHEIWRKAGAPSYFFDKKEDIKKNLLELLRPGDALLLKGSHANTLWTLIEDLTPC